jgi:hypothetical protein
MEWYGGSNLDTIGKVSYSINVPAGLTLNTDGTITVKALHQIGTYEVVYSM